MSTFTTICIIWVALGSIFTVAVLIDMDKTFAPLLKYMLVLQKITDRNKGIKKTGQEYQIEGKPPVANFAQQSPPLDPIQKKVFYTLIAIKMISFFWIVYLVIIFTGRVALILNPELDE